MGSIFNRGTRDDPNWYVKYKDHDGRWKMTASKQPTKETARRLLAQVEANVATGKAGFEVYGQRPTFRSLMDSWLSSLTNRNASIDRSRARKHLLPAFGDCPLADLGVGRLMEWIDAQRAGGLLAEASIRGNLNLVSRFFGWAIERGYATTNPVRQIPFGRRPQQAVKHDVPWVDDDDLIRSLIAALREPVNLMFYIGNRSGLRTGEIAGLRMADLRFLREGLLRVRFSYDGPLKEDKGGLGKVKWVPAPEDWTHALGPWVARRIADGAGPEDFVFPCSSREGSFYRKEYIEDAWESARQGQSVTLTWYQATRHSFVSRNLSRGASLDEVSAAVGHSSPGVTRRYYDHFIRRSFSPALRAGLGAGKEQAALPPAPEPTNEVAVGPFGAEETPQP